MCAIVGFYFISGALSVEEQCQWIRESLTNFPQPPNRTNHNAIYGPIGDIFAASKEGKFLVEVDRSRENNASEEHLLLGTINAPRWKFSSDSGVTSGGDTGKSVHASVLLHKLRWSTLGLQFDWSKVLLTFFLSSHNVPLYYHK